MKTIGLNCHADLLEDKLFSDKIANLSPGFKKRDGIHFCCWLMLEFPFVQCGIQTTLHSTKATPPKQSNFQGHMALGHVPNNMMHEATAILYGLMHMTLYYVILEKGNPEYQLVTAALEYHR